MSIFTTLDDVLITIFSSLWKNFQKVLEKSYDYKINVTKDNVECKSLDVDITNIKTGKHDNKKIIVFGVYNAKQELFTWNTNISKIFYDKLIKENIKETLGTLETLNKLFQQHVKINKKQYVAIPCLVGFFNPAYNLIKFVSENEEIEMFALVDLGIKDDINISEILAGFSLYKMTPLILKKAQLSREKNVKTKKNKKGSKKTKNNKI